MRATKFDKSSRPCMHKVAGCCERTQLLMGSWGQKGRHHSSASTDKLAKNQAGWGMTIKADRMPQTATSIQTNCLARTAQRRGCPLFCQKGPRAVAAPWLRLSRGPPALELKTRARTP